jgi:hypothetical protein
MKLAAVLIAGTLVGPIASVAQASLAQDPISIVPGTSLAMVPRGGAAGGDAVYCNGCDVIGPRNLQGGGPGGQPFDIGAGSTEDPGNLVFNWDVGDKSLFYAGQTWLPRERRLLLSVSRDGTRMWFNGRLLAWFGSSGIVFYTRPKLRTRPTR